jgi:hypothetical protein
MSMTPNEAWQELLNLVEGGASDVASRTTLQLRWLRPNRLFFSKRWQVQARFSAEPGKYSIYLERFGAELGDVNFELTPYSGEPKVTVWTMQLELSNAEAFWRFSDGQTLKSPELAHRIIDRLQRFHDEYGIAIIAPGY